MTNNSTGTLPQQHSQRSVMSNKNQCYVAINIDGKKVNYLFLHLLLLDKALTWMNNSIMNLTN